MEAAQKQKVEKLLIVGLVGVLLMVLFSSLKSIGVFGHKPRPVQKPVAPTVPEALPQPSQAQGQLTGGEAAGSVVLEGGEIQMPTIDYVADLARDPLRPAFQVQEPPEVVEATKGGVVAEVPPEVPLRMPFVPRQVEGLPPIAIRRVC